MGQFIVNSESDNREGLLVLTQQKCPLQFVIYNNDDNNLSDVVYRSGELDLVKHKTVGMYVSHS